MIRQSMPASASVLRLATSSGVLPSIRPRFEIGPRLQKKLHGLEVAGPRREHERREPAGGAGTHPAARLQHPARHVGMTAGGSPHQRGLAPLVLREPCIGAALQQPPDDRPQPMLRRRHQHRFPGRETGIRIGAGLNEPQRHVDVRVVERDPERRNAEVVDRVDVGAGCDQPAGRLAIVPVRGPMERAGAVGLRRRDVGAGIDQLSHGIPVLALGGRDDAQVIGRARRQRRGAGGCNKKEKSG